MFQWKTLWSRFWGFDPPTIRGLEILKDILTEISTAQHAQHRSTTDVGNRGTPSVLAFFQVAHCRQAGKSTKQPTKQPTAWMDCSSFRGASEVGGKIYTVKRETLCVCRGSFLAELFSGRSGGVEEVSSGGFR